MLHVSNSIIFLHSTIDYYYKKGKIPRFDCTFNFFSMLFSLPYFLVLRQNCYQEKGIINELANNCLFTIYFVTWFLKYRFAISSACASRTWKFLYPTRMGCPGELVENWGSVAITVSQNRFSLPAISGLQCKFRRCTEQNYFPPESTDKIWGRSKLSGELNIGLSLKPDLGKFMLWTCKS